MTVREFEKIFKSLYLPLGMFALRIVDDTDCAEDMVQNAFLKTWQILSDGREIDNVRHYLYGAVRNECISYLRQKKETLGPEAIPEVDDDSVDTSFRDARIWEAIDRLPEKCREIFLMSKRDGLSNQEIADEKGISVKTVKNQITKAFSRLRDELSDGHRPFFLPFL